ncbi:MAG: ABC transporter substrate-binding protein [Acholeplasmatales bacterium]|nr:ABC transporter substrate-binding protein [Acholeplasmatales bacterium]
MNKRKLLGCAAMAALATVALASCGSNADYEVGILQYATHTALGKATDGFKQALKDKLPEGDTIKFTVKNPEGDASTMLTMANTLVRNSDLVLGNATPAATQLVSSAATEGKTDLPILFTSVTDPVSAGLVTAWSGSTHTENVTGTSDINPIEAQADLIFDYDSTVDKIGFLYNISETNSQVQCEAFTEYLTANYQSCTTETETVSEQSQISSAVTKLINDGCDAIYLPTDNLMASNITTITNVTNPAKVPVYCGESGMVENGGTMSLSISYYELGYTTGEQAAEILFNGKSAKDVDVVAQTDASKMEFAYNSDAMTAMSLTFTSDFKTKYNIA